MKASYVQTLQMPSWMKYRMPGFQIDCVVAPKRLYLSANQWPRPKVNLKSRRFLITYEVSSYLLFVIPSLTSSVGSLDILFFSFDLFESSNSALDSFWTCFWFLSLEFITVSEYKTVIFVKRSISKINKMSTLRISSI